MMMIIDVPSTSYQLFITTYAASITVYVRHAACTVLATYAFRFMATRPFQFCSLACRWYKWKVLCLQFFLHIKHNHLFDRTPCHTCSIPSSFPFSCSSILSGHPSIAFLELPPVPVTLHGLTSIDMVSSATSSPSLRHALLETNIHQYAAPTELPIRPKTNPTGREVSIKLNTFHVTQYPSKAVYQYDVSLLFNFPFSESLTNIVIRLSLATVLKSVALSSAFGTPRQFARLVEKAGSSTATRSLGENTASSIPVRCTDAIRGHTQLEKELRITVDLDKEDGKKPRTDKKTGQEKPDLWRVYIKSAGTVRFDALRGYLERKSSFDDHCIEAISKHNPRRLLRIVLTRSRFS